ncbi:hypothetical protein [Pseudobdellovibrio exovorus]|uniref:hypothetical protein n=1 Tax=Pseudobdellovibrio exovorus TaxID=453816 RepID=UPI0011D1C0C8|nr:hypothetical protein [Pseudobdellovibrio exovorus]
MKKTSKSDHGFALVSFISIFPIVILLLHYSFNWASTFNKASWLRFTCLRESHSVQKRLLKHIDNPRLFNQRSRHLSHQLKIKLQSLSTSTELISYPKYERLNPLKHQLKLAFRMNTETLCGAYFKLEDNTWKIKIFYKTTKD